MPGALVLAGQHRGDEEPAQDEEDPEGHPRSRAGSGSWSGRSAPGRAPRARMPVSAGRLPEPEGDRDGGSSASPTAAAPAAPAHRGTRERRPSGPFCPTGPGPAVPGPTVPGRPDPGPRRAPGYDRAARRAWLPPPPAGHRPPMPDLPSDPPWSGRAPGRPGPGRRGGARPSPAGRRPPRRHAAADGYARPGRRPPTWWLSLLLWWHVLPHPATVTTCGCGDASLTLWVIKWPAYALAHGLNPFFSPKLFVPGGHQHGPQLARPSGSASPRSPGCSARSPP